MKVLTLVQLNCFMSGGDLACMSQLPNGTENSWINFCYLNFGYKQRRIKIK